MSNHHLPQQLLQCTPIRAALGCLLIFGVIVGCQPSSTKSTANPASSDVDVRSNETKKPSTEAMAGTSIQFTEMTKAAGIDWIPRNGEEQRNYAILESLGTGCAIADYDQDGLLDIFLTGGGTIGSHREIEPLPMALYRQSTAWKFLPVQTVAGLASMRHYNHGVSVADMDEDGFPDVLITGYGGLQLFRNHGDGTFVDDTESGRLDDKGWSSAAGWGDLNRDGVLDLYVGHYVNWSWQNHPACGGAGHRIVCPPSTFQGTPCTAYLGTGDGAFRDVTQELGINQNGKVLGVVIADLDDTGQLDIYAANDTVPNHFYRRQPSGEYQNVGLENGVALGEKGESDGSMGTDVGDLNADGRLDIWVANFENESFALYQNLGNEFFRHSSRAFGVTAVGTMAVGFGTVIFDVNGDGFPDIFCTNGHIHAPDFPVDRRQYPFLFLNERGKRVRNIAPTAGDYFRSKHLGRGAACGDIDGNGTLDLVVANLQEPVALLRNDTPIKNWLEIRLIGRSSPRSAIGARVTIKIGHDQQVNAIRGGGSYLSTSDLTIFFGVGDSKVIDSLEIHWPSGLKQQLSQIASCQKMAIVEPAEHVQATD